MKIPFGNPWRATDKITDGPNQSRSHSHVRKLCKPRVLLVATSLSAVLRLMTAQKLTKKQKKGLAFREKRTGKTKKNDAAVSDGLEGNEVPVMELQDEADAQADTDSVEDPSVDKKNKKSSVDDKGKGSAKGKGKASENDTPVVAASKKRPREVSSDQEENKESEKTRKKRKGGPDGVGPSVSENPPTQATPAKQRFILFVGACLRFHIVILLSYSDSGNLKYTTTAEAVQAHFAMCGLSMFQDFSDVHG